jgi:hypothetical protein
MSWDPPVSNGGTPIMEYQVKIYPDNYIVYFSHGQNVVVTQLINGKYYYFQIRARNAAGYSAWSQESDWYSPGSTVLCKTKNISNNTNTFNF